MLQIGYKHLIVAFYFITFLFIFSCSGGKDGGSDPAVAPPAGTVPTPTPAIENIPPVMPLDQSLVSIKNIILSFNLDAASDENGDSLSYRVVDAPQNGTLSDCIESNNDLECNYIPNTDYVGADSFTYMANDGELDSESVCTVNITIDAVNNLPIMPADQNASTNEDIAIVISLDIATDIDGDSLVYFVVDGPSNGSISNCMGGTDDLICDYSPNANFNGADSFTYKANDGISDSATVATVNITIGAVNDLPLMPADQNASTDEDIPASIALDAATDVDGDSLIYFIVAGPSSGSISNCMGGTNDLVCDYSPNANFNGADSFTYKANDGTADSATVTTVNITVNAVNDLPVMPANQNASTDEDIPVSITLDAATDVDGDSLIYFIVAGPSNGSISNCMGGTNDLICDYTPAANFNGSDSFTYKANDGTADSSTVTTVNITINAVNDLPIMPADQAASTDEDVPISITLDAASDIDGDSLIYFIVSGPSNGQVSNCMGGTDDLICDYSPNANFNGADSFTYKANDGTADSTTVTTVNITVNAVNNLPIMPADQSAFTNEDVSIVISLDVATDIDGDSLVYYVVSGPSDGLISNCMSGTDDLICDYSPNANFNGTDSFTYKANDGTGDSATVTTVTITVNPVNDLPVMPADQVASTDEDVSISITLDAASDIDGDSLIYFIVSGPSNGSISNCMSGTDDLICDYSPNANFNGADSFTYKTNDGTADSATVTTVNITVNPVNDLPVMPADQVASTDEDTPVLITLDVATDLDGDSLIYFIVTGPSNGLISNCMGGTDDLICDYSPNDDFNGIDSFTYKANDGTDDSATVTTVNITINAVNDLPVMPADQVASTDEDIPLSITLDAASDIDGDSLIYFIVSGPSSGSISNCMSGTNDLICDYSPNADFNGADFFTYKANDGTADSATVTTINITINAVNDQPVLINNFAENFFKSSIDNTITSTKLLIEDVDDNANKITYEITSLCSAGDLFVNGVLLTVGSTFKQKDVNINKLTYNNTDGNADIDTFTFSFSDDSGSPQIPGNIFTINLIEDYNQPDTISLCVGGNSLNSNSLTGTLYDSGGPAGDFGENENCSLIVSPPGAGEIVLTFSAFITEDKFNYTLSRWVDALEIYDGVDETGTLLSADAGFRGDHSGDLETLTVTAISGSMFIKFVSDPNAAGGYYVENNPNTGFVATWDSPFSPLTANPQNVSIAYGEDLTIFGLGGSMEYGYSLESGPGSINSSTGVYSAPDIISDVSDTAVVRVIDFTSNFADVSFNLLPSYWLCDIGFNTSFRSSGYLFDSGGNNLGYGNDETCAFTISPTDATMISLNFQMFDTQSGVDKLWVYKGFDDLGEVLLDGVSGNSIPNEIVSLTDSLYVKFISDSATVANGFKSKWTSTTTPTYILCDDSSNSNKTTDLATGQFYDVGGPNQNYSNQQICTIAIDPPGTDNVTITFDYMHTEEDYDFIQVYDGIDATAPSLGQFSGTTNPGTITSTSGAIFIKFVADDLLNEGGFHISWELE